MNPLVHLNPPRESIPVPVAPAPTVVQPLPVTIPITQAQHVTTPQSIKQTKMPTIVSRTNQASVRFPNYKMMIPGNVSRKSTSRRTRVMELASGLQHYDIISDMDNIKPQITMRQLLAIAPHCRSKLSSSMIRKKPKIVDIHDVTLSKDPRAPAVDVLIPSFQVDTGSSVNLMSQPLLAPLNNLAFLQF